MQKILPVLFFLSLSSAIANHAQTIGWTIDDISNAELNDTSAGKLALTISTSNFVKNNEYFNQMVEGYTLIGFWAEPTLEYAVGSMTSIRAGLSAVRFFGKDGFYATEPILRIRHGFTPHVSLTMGSLPYSQYGMPAPLLDPERFYLHRVNNGALFQVSFPSFSSDSWLSWDRFSFYGDTVQELVSAGNGSLITLLQRGKFKVQLPVYLIITHRGGQVVRPKQPIETLVNAGIGAKICWKGARLSMEFTPNGFLYQKLTNHPSQPFSKGWAFYPVLTLLHGRMIWESSWWHGQNFIAPKGELIYTQLSTYNKDVIAKSHDVVVNKLGYRTALTHGIQLEAAVESYYFPSEKRMDYNFWVHFNWYFRHHLKRLNPEY